MSGLFELITYPLSLPIDPFWEWIIMGIVATISFVIAYRSVHILKFEAGISNSGILSIIHWILRIVIYFGIWAILCGIIKIVQWVINIFR